jgi:hypothetical protein
MESHITLVTREQVREHLLAWQSGELTAAQVHQWAESIYFPGATDFDDWDALADDSSVANEVMQLLDALDINLLTRDVVPVMLNALAAPPGATVSACESLDEWLDARDMNELRRELASDPLYNRFL